MDLVLLEKLGSNSEARCILNHLCHILASPHLQMFHRSIAWHTLRQHLSTALIMRHDWWPLVGRAVLVSTHTCHSATQLMQSGERRRRAYEESIPKLEGVLEEVLMTDVAQIVDAVAVYVLTHGEER